MIKALLSGAAVVAALTGVAAAAPADSPSWVVTPTTDSCRTDLELSGPSGASVDVALISDGERLGLLFRKDDAPSQAFLPIRIDHKPYANLVMRSPDGKSSIMQLSAETQAALRRGGSLQISWLAQEVVGGSLTGSQQGLMDLRTCGAQMAARYRDQQAVQDAAKAKTEAEARAKAVADEQLAAAKAQKDAAEAEAQRNTAEAERLHAAAEADRARATAEQQQQAERERETEQAQARAQAAYAYQRGGYYYPSSGYYPQATQEPRYTPEPSEPDPYGRW